VSLPPFFDDMTGGTILTANRWATGMHRFSCVERTLLPHGTAPENRTRPAGFGDLPGSQTAR